MSRPAVTASVAASATSVALFADDADGNVVGRSVHNDSAAVLYLKYGATASTSDFTVIVGAGGLYEFPRPVYNGVVHGIWSSATGNARTTEVS